MISIKKYKHLIIVSIVLLLSIILFIACGKKEEKSSSNITVKYEATIDVDEVICKIGDIEIKLTPMHDDKKVKAGYSNSCDFPKEKDTKVLIKIIDDNKTVYENNNLNVDLSGEKVGNLLIVGNNLDDLKVDIINK